MEAVVQTFRDMWLNFLGLMTQRALTLDEEEGAETETESSAEALRASLYLSPDQYVQYHFRYAVLAPECPPCPLCLLYAKDRYYGLNDKTMISYTITVDHETGFEVVHAQVFDRNFLAWQQQQQLEMQTNSSSSDPPRPSDQIDQNSLMGTEEFQDLVTKFTEYMSDWVVLATCPHLYHQACLLGYLDDERQHCIICTKKIIRENWTTLRQFLNLKTPALSDLPLDFRMNHFE